jgi:sugar lactone lactonase YvrE
MKNKLTETKFKSAFGRSGWLFSMVASLGAVILICSSASAQNLFVSGRDAGGGEIFKFTWDGKRGIVVSELYKPRDLAFDSARNLFFVDYEIVGELRAAAAIYKVTPNGTLTIFASGLSYASNLAVDKAGNLLVADYDDGIIYKYKPNGSRGTFASGLYHPAGMAFDSAGNLFVADSSVGDNIYQGSIYKYKPNGSRVTFAVLNPSDRPAGLAFNSLGNLFMADLSGKIYKYNLNAVLGPQGRTTFGSVPNSAESLAFDSAGNLFVVDAGAVSTSGAAIPNAIYKFSQQGARSTFASKSALGETFSHVAFQPIACCQ